MTTCDVAIIGAGIIGTACAHHLTNAGLRVAVVEAKEPGGGDTNAGMGHLVLMDDSAAQFNLTRYSLELWGKLAPKLPADCEYWRCGTLWVAVDEKDLKIAAGRVEFCSQNGVPARLIDQGELNTLEPNLRPDLPGGLLIPSDSSVRPAAVARYFMQQAIANGATLLHKRAIGIDDVGVHLDDGSFLYAGALINAAGTAAPELVSWLPISPRKGHILVVDAGTSFAHHQVLEIGYVKSTHASEDDSVAFNVRHNMSGELLIGSSRQYGVTDPAMEPRIIRQMLKRAIEFMPAIANARPLRNWTGFRAATPDGLPLIGECPGFRRVFAATGHEGLGATTSLGTARLLTDMILGLTPEIDPEPYRPSRFLATSTGTEPEKL